MKEVRTTVPGLARKKRAGEKIAMLTAYDHAFARILDAAGIDVLLVGDSLGNVVQGHDTTLPVTLDEVVRAAAGSNRNAAGGIYRDRGQEFVIRGIGRVRDTEEIARTVVAVHDGVPVLLDQVADVVIGAAPKIGDGSVNGTAGVVLLNVLVEAAVGIEPADFPTTIVSVEKRGRSTQTTAVPSRPSQSTTRSAGPATASRSQYR